jgi:hypothetical protein
MALRPAGEVDAQSDGRPDVQPLVGLVVDG